MPQDNSTAAIVVTDEPNMANLQWSLRSLEEQTRPPDEVIIVDQSEPPLELDNSGTLDASLTHVPKGNGRTPRAVGMEMASSDRCVQMDGNTVLVSKDYIERTNQDLNRRGVSGVGGVVRPVSGNASGEAVAVLNRFNPTPSGVGALTHERRLCLDNNGACVLPKSRPEMDAINEIVSRNGDVARDSRLLVLQDLPTSRQSNFVKTVAGAVGGAAVTAVTSHFISRALGSGEGD